MPVILFLTILILHALEPHVSRSPSGAQEQGRSKRPKAASEGRFREPANVGGADEQDSGCAVAPTFMHGLGVI